MSYAADVTLAIIAVLVVALAGYLLLIFATLRHIIDRLGKVNFGVAAIASRVQPLESVLTEINTDLETVADAVDGLASKPATRRRRTRAAS